MAAALPTASYEDVTGLCKLATRAEIEEQDWSLNPGRYVGVVVEEDGKTEEEFLEGMSEALEELLALSEAAAANETVVFANLQLVLGEA